MTCSMVRAGLLAAICLAVLSTGADGAPVIRTPVGPKLGTVGKPVTTYLCPAMLNVAYQNISNQSADLGPWLGFDSVNQMLYLDTSPNGVTVMGGYMRCQYKYSPAPGANRDDGPFTTLYQQLNGRQCVVRPDRKGFDCTGP